MASALRRPGLAGALLLASLAAWGVALEQLRGMDAGPGTDLGAFGWFLGIWVTMMAAMMLPSAAPAVLMFSELRDDAPPWAFAAGYLLAWTGAGLVAYGSFRGLAALAPSFTAWEERGAWVAGGALVAAGLYQLTPLKTACLRHCRAPVGLLLRSGPGRAGAVGTGLRHGAYCIGCCAGLMLALFALGVMSLVWMAVVAGVILVEKVSPRGELVARTTAVVLVAAGALVAVAPESVPGLTQPTGAELRMELEMQP